MPVTLPWRYVFCPDPQLFCVSKLTFHTVRLPKQVDKFMSRIVTPDMDEALAQGDHAGIAAHVHQYTHGINSDPITLLAIVFSALIHDTGK